MFFGPDPLSVAFVIVCALLGIVSGVLAFRLRDRLGHIREDLQHIGQVATEYGLTKTAAAAFAWACNTSAKWHYLKDLFAILRGGPDKILDELKGAFFKLAKTPAGHKVLSDALAAADAAKVTAPPAAA